MVHNKNSQKEMTWPVAKKQQQNPLQSPLQNPPQNLRPKRNKSS